MSPAVCHGGLYLDVERMGRALRGLVRREFQGGGERVSALWGG